MILVTLGTQKFQMDRLIKAVDKIAPNLDEEIFIQTGNSGYRPINCKYSDFVEPDLFKSMIEECSMLITHAGVGSIMTGVKNTKPVIVVPRMAKYHEHVDDHQLQIAEAFAQKQIVLACEDTELLEEYINKAKAYNFKPYISPEGVIQDIIINFIENI